MMKRIVSLALVLVMVLCMVPVTVSAAETELGLRPLEEGETYQEMTVSDAMITMIMDMEGFSATPYKDNSQLSIGYGSCYSTDTSLDTTGVSWTPEQAKAQLISDVNSIYGTEVNKFCKKIGKQPTQQQFDALVSFTYNVGGNWTKGCRLSRWLTNPTTLDEFINSMGIWCRSAGTINYTLACRRVREIIVFLYGEYTLQNGKVVGAVAGKDTDLKVVSNSALPYIKFVVYQANGGSFDSNVSTYSSYIHYYLKNSSGIKPVNVTREGYTLTGWTITRESGNKTTKGESFTAGTVLSINLEITAQWTASVCSHTNTTTASENATAATCTKGGSYESVVYCANCGQELSRKTVATPTAEHRFESGTCTVCGVSITRLAGSNRCATAIAVANEMKAVLGLTTFDSIIITSGNSYADALAGSHLAVKEKAPILLYRADSAGSNLAYIQKNLTTGGTVYILGGTAAVPASVDASLEAAGIQVIRLAGDDRYDTNLAILAECDVSSGAEILVCVGGKFADSLSASATGKPILLINDRKQALTASQIAYLKSLRNISFTIIGGTSAISDKLVNDLSAYGTINTRLSGANRYATSVAIAEHYSTDTDTIVLAYGKNYPDGLCGGPLACFLGAPLLLTQVPGSNSSNSNAVSAPAAYWKESGGKTCYVLGGTAAVADETVMAVIGN